MRRYDRRILVWAPPASQADGLPYNAARPVHGTQPERNVATALFHARMAEALPGDIVGILDRLLIPDNRTRAGWLYDGTHLSQSAMPLALAELERVTGWRPGWVPEAHPVLVPTEARGAPVLVDIAPGARWHMPGRDTGSPSPYRSQPQKNPSLRIDFGATRSIETLRITFPNAADAADTGIVLETSADTIGFGPFAGEAPHIEGVSRTYRLDGAMIRMLRVVRPGKMQVLDVTAISATAWGFTAAP